MRQTTLLLATLILLLLGGCRPGDTPRVPDEEESETIELTAVDFNRLVRTHDATKIVLREQKPTILEVHFPACPDCREVKPYIEALAEELAPKGVPVYKLNCRRGVEEQRIAASLGARYVPTLFFVYRDGSFVSLMPQSAWPERDTWTDNLRSEAQRMIDSYR